MWGSTLRVHIKIILIIVHAIYKCPLHYFVQILFLWSECTVLLSVRLKETFMINGISEVHFYHCVYIYN